MSSRVSALHHAGPLDVSLLAGWHAGLPCKLPLVRVRRHGCASTLPLLPAVVRRARIPRELRLGVAGGRLLGVLPAALAVSRTGGGLRTQQSHRRRPVSARAAPQRGLHACACAECKQRGRGRRCAQAPRSQHRAPRSVAGGARV